MKVQCVPMKGDLVLGQVVSVGDKISTLLVSLIVRKRNNGVEFIRLPRTTHAYLFRGDVNYPCVSLSEVVKIGDLLLGEVKIDWFRPFFISLSRKECGVVATRCGQCGSTFPLPREYDKLVCPVCRNVRRTKISILYEPALWRELHMQNMIRIYLSVQ